MTLNSMAGQLEKIKAHVEDLDPNEADDFIIPEVGCKRCNWTGYVYTDPGGLLVGPCTCLKARGLKHWIKSYRASVYVHCPEDAINLNSIDPEKGAIPKAIAEFRKHRHAQEKCNSIGLVGGPGVGKTTAGHYLVHKMMRKFERPAVYLNCRFFGPRYADQVENQQSKAYVLRLKREVDEKNIMFFDDLGAEKEGSAAAQCLGEMLQIRFEKRAPTVLTSNLDGSRLVSRYGGIGMSRMTSGGKWMLIVGFSPSDFHDLRAGDPLKAMRGRVQG